MSLTYHSYLKLDDLLNLQDVKSVPAEHDEYLFIVIHQVYELWFKILLQEFEKVCRDFSDNDLYAAMASFKRARTVMKTLVAQVDILETMTPMSFSSFRDRLDTASGFQSWQYRELEFLLGYKRPDMLRYHDEGSTARARLQERLDQRSVVDHFYDFLSARGVTIPAHLRQRDVRLPAIPDESVQAGILKLYKTQPDLTILLELMTDFDEGLQEWRYRHVKLVERTIGSKRGTGGSLGVEFLKKSLFMPCFPDLWVIRHEL